MTASVIAIFGVIYVLCVFQAYCVFFVTQFVVRLINFWKMYRQKYLTQAEIERLINESSDEEEIATLMRDADNVDLVLLPPERVDELSDVENIDENVQILNDPSAFVPSEVAGEIEVICEFDDCNVNKPARADDFDEDSDADGGDVDDDDDEGGATSKRTKPGRCGKAAKKAKSAPKKKKADVPPAKWSKAKKVSFARQPVNIENEKIVELFEKYGLCFCSACPIYHMLTKFVLVFRQFFADSII